MELSKHTLEWESEEGRREVPVALTIAGSDSGGGAGIQADLKTFSSLGAFGVTVITAITAQNTCGVRAIQMIDVDVIRAQIEAVVEDFRPQAAKTGMLGTREIISTVARCVDDLGIERLVVDPVMVSKSGHQLLEPEARKTLREQLIPRALVLTPNAPEAYALTGIEVVDADSARKAARALRGMGASWVVVKGGHLPAVDAKHGLFRRVFTPLEESGGKGRDEASPGAEAPGGVPHGLMVDYVYDGEILREIATPSFANKNTHGTGCVFSAAIAALLSGGLAPADAIVAAKQFVAEAIAAGLPLGSGVGPANPMARIWRSSGPGLVVPVYERVR